jgi:hypothetical protein
MALGATRGGIVRLVLGEIAALLLLGIPLGLATLAAARLVRSVVLDLTPNRSATIAVAIAVLLITADLAVYFRRGPPRRPSRSPRRPTRRVAPDCPPN